MTIIHKFESAGLGQAPFRYVGYQEITYQACPGAPVVAGGSCDYCGACIRDAFFIESADHKKFKVGSDCIYKIGDAGLVDTVKRAANQVKTQKRHEREKQFIALNEEKMIEKFAKLSDIKHPNSYFAEQGKTMRDYQLFLYQNRGPAAKIKMIKEWLKNG